MPERYFFRTYHAEVAVSIQDSDKVKAATQESQYSPSRPDTFLRSDLHECVSTYDADRLAEIDQGREYRISGWFIDRPHTDAVINCMKIKGWRVFGESLLDGL
jgi:hypothetical protein